MISCLCERRVATVCFCRSVSLKTCGELLELGQVCNSRQLVATCQTFICLNMASLLEARSLDMLTPRTMQEVSRCYKEQVSQQVLQVRQQVIQVS